MEIEIEVKAKCRNLAEIKKRLRKMGAKYQGRVHQIDTYYLFRPKKSARQRVPLLRIREDKPTGQSFFEYHEPVNIFKAREHAIEIDNPKLAKFILKKLGYQDEVIVDKIREKFSFQGLHIDLDQVKGLGQFIEVECMRNRPNSLKRIYSFLDKLKIPKKDLIPEMRYIDEL